jgi:hypothetical protein
MSSRRRTLGACALLVLGLGACSVERVNESEVGIHYTQGPIEGEKFDHVIEPGGSSTVVDDVVYRLPARQVTYISAAGEESDAPPLSLTAQGGERLQVSLAVRFFLNSREEALRPFFLEICQKHDCWEDEGWLRMLRETFGNPMQAVVNDLGLEYEAEQLRYNNEVRDQFSAAFAERFVDQLERLVGRGDFFCGPGYDRDEEECPALSVEISSVHYENAELEGIREQQELAVQEEALAAQTARTARAEQEAVAAQATPEWERQQQTQAMRECAQNPECQLTVILGGGDVGVTVPAG